MKRLRKNPVAQGVVAVLILLGAACSPNGDSSSNEDSSTVALMQEAALPVGVGRSFRAKVRYHVADEAEEKQILFALDPVAEFFRHGRTYSDDDYLSVLVGLMERFCRDTAEKEIAHADPPVAGSDRAELVNVDTEVCLGHWFLKMAESPLLTVVEVRAPLLEINENGTFLSGLEVDVRQVGRDDDIAQEGFLPVFVIPPQDASGAATLAIVASTFFRLAVLDGAWHVRRCAGGTCAFTARIPTGELHAPVPGQTGPSGTVMTPTVPLGFAMMSAVVDAWNANREATAEATRLILAASRARNAAEEANPRHERFLRWRGMYDSRLEAANLLVGVAPRMFEPDPTITVPLHDMRGALVGYGPVPALAEYPVMADIALSEEDRRAEEILRSVRVDPRRADVLHDTMTALHEDAPDSFSFEGSADEFFGLAGISAAAMRRAASRLVAESTVFGYPIVPEHVVQGLPEPPGVTRVVGTTPHVLGPQPAYLYALTAGGVRVDSIEIMENYTDIPLQEGEPSVEYALRSAYGTLDFAAAGFHIFLGTMDHYYAFSSEDRHNMRQVALSLMAEARNEVPLRADLELEGNSPQTGDGAITSMELVLYGSRAEIGEQPEEDYQFWWGEEGLECALSGRVGPLLCDPVDYLVDMNLDTDETGHGGASGKDLKFRWTAQSPLIPPAIMLRSDHEADKGTGTFQPTGRLYLTRKMSRGVEALAGFDIAPYRIRPGRLSWVRHTQYPVGPGILAELTDILAARPDEPSEPVMTCAGLPADVLLPLEDELTEAIHGADDIESSFAYYLSLARRAATEADELGEVILRHGLEMDLRAEAAQGELEDICGAVFDVPSFDLVTDRGCTSDDECPTGEMCFAGACNDDAIRDMLPETSIACEVQADCGNEGACFYGSCAPAIVADYLSERACRDDDECDQADGEVCFAERCGTEKITELVPSSDPSLEPLRRCMGAAENEPILASLGTKPLCVYHKEGLPPCSCDLPDQTLCPACPVAIGESSCDIEQDGPFAVLSGLGYTTQLTEPLKLVDAEQQGHLQVDCVALAQLRHRWDASKRRSSVDIRGSDQWSAIKNQEWLRYGVVRPLAEGFDAALLPQWHSAARLGNRVWFSTGNIEDGASSKFPCAPAALDADTLSSLFCDAAPGPLGRSILCGLGDCESTCGGTTAVHRISSLCSAGHSCYFPDTDELFGADGCDGREAIYHRLLRGRRELLRMAGYDVASPSFPGAPSNAFVGAYYVNLVTWALCSSNGLLQATSAVPVPRLEPNALLRSYRLPERSENGWNCLGRPWEFVGEGNDRLYASLRDGAGPGLEASAEESPVVWGGVATCYGQWEVTESSRDQTEVGRCPLALVNPTVIPGDIAAATSGGPNLLLLPEDQWRPIEEDSRTIIGQLRDVYDGEGKENWGAQNASFFDALELACHAVADDANGCPASLEEVPQIDSPAQLPKLERYLDCAADRLAERGATLMLSDLPRSVADDLRNQTISATYPAFRGELGETVAELRGSLEALPAAFAQMSTAIRSFSYAVRIARSQYSVKELEHKISLLQMASETSRNLAACAAASSPATSAGMNAGVTFNYGAAVAICADAGAQFVISMMKTDVVEDIGDHEKGQILDGAGMSFSDALDLLAEGARNLSAGYANVNRLLARLDGQRRKARRQVSRLMFLENDEVGREFAVNRVMRARMNSTLDRYKKARNNAIRLAWLARRAIEQRLGLSLNDIKTDMSLVDAPSTWADSVCDITGINYDELAEGTIDNYATQYVGDYVRQLENFVESYRLDFPFQDGQDIAVLSLKDDLLRLKVPCETEGYNELLWSADLTRPASATADGWEALCSDEGRCPMVQSHPSSPFLGDGLTAASGEQSARRPMGAVSAVRMTLGCAADLYDEQDYSCPVAETAGAGLAQVIEAARRGTYIVSWYERVEASNSPALVAIVTYDDGRKEAVLPDEFLPETQDLFLSTGWGRAAGLVYNAEEQDLEIRFEFRDAQADGGSLPSVVWAAPQVELLTPSFVDNEETVIPWPFFPTDDDFASEVGLCSDTDGSQFHHSGVWTYGCEYFCPDGFSGSCGDGPQDRALQRCYYQTEFALSLTEIEKGELIPSNSLALGNFNYRINSFGLNLVGRNLRDCSRSSSPASCESSGFLSYSLRHGPPYRVRNVWGDVYRAPLFVGNVEHAKALATERVLTNPMRPSTQAQLNQYTREEFRGRPLEGTYRLRIYDVDGLQWENLADVQIFLDYRYWTRFGG